VNPRQQAVLAATLGFATLSPDIAELHLLHRWLDSWRGLGDIVVGMHRAGWDLQLTQYGDGYWRATFFVTGMAHSIVGGSAWEATAWRAVQSAAGVAMNRSETP
jgi:hypothetical protein